MGILLFIVADLPPSDLWWCELKKKRMCFYLRRSRAGLGLLRGVVVVIIVNIFLLLLSKRPPTKIFIKTKL